VRNDTGKRKKKRISELGLRIATAWRRGGDFTRQRGTGGGGELEAKDGGGGYGYPTVRSDVKQKKEKKKNLSGYAPGLPLPACW
jgi:hypothetical protein